MEGVALQAAPVSGSFRRVFVGAVLLWTVLGGSHGIASQLSISPERKVCKYGQEEGYWSSVTYQVFSEECQLQRHVDSLSRQVKEGVDSRLKGSILFIGDSVDRNLLNWIGDKFADGADDLTPFQAYETVAGDQAKTSLNRQVWVGDLHISNLYIFGVGDAPYPERSRVAATPGMHNRTMERVCVDAPRYLPVAPDVVVVNSAYWDAIRLCYSKTYAWRRKHEKHLNRPTCFHESKVDWEKFVLEYMQDVYRLLFGVKACFPSAKTIVWRTAPEVSVDDRNPWFHVIPPYVTAYLNNAARYAAQKYGFEIINMDIMAGGRANDLQWTPDGVHQSSDFNREYLNVVLNILTEAYRRTGPE
mmetsp:Transcript_29448/g.83055  ORF Transcript_29448/g.83055 Transcript_29448/m.83055 type:complete len:359 (-) Transcript_29448:259-1335(-)|eukprot:CAMPEP_0117681164 /NCGR_PEP_ID=MMETSP0804-20121206/18807_1 /TAXON_ID=1074897 /ORGANISM="Tetraselmis astigmatica, Strain CCMP880" /LENGTH=358 /DNA_ID=CAMNT_0005490845 /DNA_START=447 /DNA_END=1523 /DNA_ORIENTATION=-